MISRSDEVKNGITQLLTILALKKSEANYELFVRLESSLSFKKLIKILKEISTSNETEPILMLKPLVDFFNDRWKKILKTDAIYPHAPYSQANLACLIVERFIIVYFDKHVYELVMPDLPWTQCLQQNEKVNDLHKFIILADDEHPMDIMRILAMNHKQNRSDLSKSQVFFEYSEEGSQRQLQCLERVRLVNHAIFNDYREKLKNKEACNVNYEVINQQLMQEFTDRAYTLSSSYDELGKLRLKQNILSELTSWQDLLDLMLEHLPNRDDWQTLLSEIPVADLCRIVLGIEMNSSDTKYSSQEEFERILLKKADNELNRIVHKLEICYEENWVRARIYALREIYHRARNIEPEIKSFIGQCANRVVKPEVSGSFSKTTKSGSSEVFGYFLLSAHPLHDVEGYLYENNGEDKRWHDLYWGALTINPYLLSYFTGSSTLVKLVQITIAAGNKILEQNNKIIEKNNQLSLAVLNPGF